MSVVVSPALLLPVVLALSSQVEGSAPAGDAPPVGTSDDDAAPDEAGPAEEPSPATPDVSGVPEARRDLVLGIRWLEALEPERALASLEEARDGGPYRLDDVIALYHHLGIARAYLGDEAGAVSAFEHLLAVAPGHSLAYTTSPRATLLFQKALDKVRDRRALELRLETAPVVPLDEPVVVTLTAAGDPLGLVKQVAVLHRRKGEAEFSRLELDRPPVGEAIEVALPAVPSLEALPDGEGLTGALLEVAVVGYDVRGWEVYAGPAPSRPLEVPVGYTEPVPWYGHWWVWAIVGGAAVTTVATGGAIAVARLWPKPETISADFAVGP